MIKKMNWIDLSEHWDEIELAAEARDKQKSPYKSTKNWSRHRTHLVGLAAETTFALEVGLEVDLTLSSAGDGGSDFTHLGKEYDIKGSIYWLNPHLKQYPNPKRWVDYYVLVGVDMRGRRGRVAGWASAEEVKNAPLVDYGYGKMLTIQKPNKGKGPW